MVIPRARASSLSNVNVCSPKATMTLYDIFSHYRVLDSLRITIVYVCRGKEYKSTGSRRVFSEFFPKKLSQLKSIKCEDSKREIE